MGGTNLEVVDFARTGFSRAAVVAEAIGVVVAGDEVAISGVVPAVSESSPSSRTQLVLPKQVHPRQPTGAL